MQTVGNETWQKPSKEYGVRATDHNVQGIPVPTHRPRQSSSYTHRRSWRPFTVERTGEGNLWVATRSKKIQGLVVDERLHTYQGLNLRGHSPRPEYCHFSLSRSLSLSLSLSLYACVASTDRHIRNTPYAKAPVCARGARVSAGGRFSLLHVFLHECNASTE